MRSLKLMLGITPVFILAAIIESFLTRYTDVPDFIKAILILLSAVFIVGYFGVYPWLKLKKGFDQPLTEVRLAASAPENFNYGQIKNNAEIFKAAFMFYRKYGNQLMMWIGAVTLFMSIGYFFSLDDNSGIRYSVWWEYFLNNLFYALQTPSIPLVLINATGSALVIYRVLSFISMDSKSSANQFDLLSFAQTFVITACVYFILYALEGWGILILILSFVLFLLAVFVQLTEKINLFLGIAETVSLARANFGKAMGLQLILLIIMFSFLMVLTAPIMYFNMSVLQWNFAKTDDWAKYIFRFLDLFVKILGFNLVLPILTACSAYLFFSLRETLTADALKKSISQIGAETSKRTRR
jgi:hypothetical protein